MKIKLNDARNEVTLTGAFNLQGVPTTGALKAAETGKGDLSGLNHGAVNFAEPTGVFFDGADGQKRELYFYGGFTSHLVKSKTAKPKL